MNNLQSIDLLIYSDNHNVHHIQSSNNNNNHHSNNSNQSYGYHNNHIIRLPNHPQYHQQHNNNMNGLIYPPIDYRMAYNNPYFDPSTIPLHLRPTWENNQYNGSQNTETKRDT